MAGYRYVSGAHDCLRDVLILKKNVPGMNWVKVRVRPETKCHYGAFKICTQFGQNKPCKVGEEKCTFPHHQAESILWAKDKDRTFLIENFITQCRTYKICKYILFLNSFLCWQYCNKCLSSMLYRASIKSVGL